MTDSKKNKKHCKGIKGCDTWKDKSEFQIRNQAADGLQHYCKACTRENYKNYRHIKYKKPNLDYTRKRIHPNTRAVRERYDFERPAMPELWINGLKEIEKTIGKRGFAVMWNKVKERNEIEDSE